MEKLVKKHVEIDSSLNKEIEKICSQANISFSELIRQVLLNDGIVMSTCKDLNIRQMFLLGKIKNLTSQCKTIIWSSDESDSFNYELDSYVEDIEYMTRKALSISSPSNLNSEDYSVKTISYIPSSDVKFRTDRSFRIQAELAEELNRRWKEDGIKIKPQVTQALENLKLLTPLYINEKEEALERIVETGNRLNDYLRYVHSKRKSEGYIDKKLIRHFGDMLQRAVFILQHDLALITAKRNEN
ncbi:hypothetical protein M0Q57_004560 [Vibrio parahaemolyticus]|nr:hypothetical protein [Vibrio parahaemolyticus]